MTQEYAEIARRFDRFAGRYDDSVEPNPIHAHLRTRSLAWLDQAFTPGMRVLEIGCGTGTEALHLARRGVEVTAIDISEQMVQRTLQRIREADMGQRVNVLHASSADIASCFGEATFDGAYASFGPLNCGPRLDAVARDLSRVLREGAVFATSIISRPCGWELLAGTMLLKPRKAFRRLRGTTVIDLEARLPLEIRTYSEGELRRALSPWFAIERLEGWLVVVPPPYLAEVWTRFEVLHEPAYRAERILSRRWPFRGWGEHIHVWARRCA